jgi:hypothetical protein
MHRHSPSWVFTQALYPSLEVKDKEEREEKMNVDDKEKDQEKQESKMR